MTQDFFVRGTVERARNFVGHVLEREGYFVDPAPKIGQVMSRGTLAASALVDECAGGHYRIAFDIHLSPSYSEHAHVRMSPSPTSGGTMGSPPIDDAFTRAVGLVALALKSAGLLTASASFESVES